MLTGGATTGGSSTATGAVTTGGGIATDAGFSCTAGGIVETTGGRGGAVIAGRGGAGGCCCCISFSRKSLRTSPGLEILERSSFGLISAGADLSREDAELDLLIKYFRIFSASSTSTELEWVFFSVMPTSNNISRIALLFTSSSRARSLIRIFVIRSAFPPSMSVYAIIMTSRFPSFYRAKNYNHSPGSWPGFDLSGSATSPGAVSSLLSPCVWTSPMVRERS